LRSERQRNGSRKLRIVSEIIAEVEVECTAASADCDTGGQWNAANLHARRRHNAEVSHIKVETRDK
jgi:hypothetical protein